MSQTELAISEFKNEASYPIHNIIEEMILKYQITEDMNPTKIKIHITKHVLNDMFENLLNNGIVTNDNKLYIYGIYKSYNKIEIINDILKHKKYRLNLKKIIKCLYDNIIDWFTIKKNDLQTINNLDKINKIIKVNDKLDKKQKKITESINEWNNQALETTYKQSRTEIEMNNEIFQQEFQKTNIGINFEMIKQQYESQILSKTGQIIKRQTQISTLNQNRLINRQNLDNLRHDLLITELEHKDAQAIIAEHAQANLLQQQILDESIAFRSDLNKSFTHIIDTMKEQNQALIDAIATTFQKTSEVIQDASKATADAITQSGIAIQQTIQQEHQVMRGLIVQNAIDTNARLQQMGANIQTCYDRQTVLNSRIDVLLNTIGQAQAQALTHGFSILGGTPLPQTQQQQLPAYLPPQVQQQQPQLQQLQQPQRPMTQNEIDLQRALNAFADLTAERKQNPLNRFGR